MTSVADRADDGAQLARRHLEAHGVDGEEPAEALAQSFGAQQGGCGHGVVVPGNAYMTSSANILKIASRPPNPCAGT